MKKLKSWKSNKTGKILEGYWNDSRNQYEVYSSTQQPKIVPLGADPDSLAVALSDAIETMYHRKIKWQN